MHNYKAYTLLELLIVLAIITIISSLVISPIKHFLAKFKHDTMLSQLKLTLATAQQLAHINRQATVVCASVDGKSCGGNWADGQIIYASDNPKQILRIFKMQSIKATLRWRAYPRYRASIKFQPNIMRASDNGTFWLCPLDSAQPAWALIINQQGKTRVLYPRQGKIYDSHQKELTC